jgi:hypothetical protein
MWSEVKTHIYSVASNSENTKQVPDEQKFARLFLADELRLSVTSETSTVTLKIAAIVYNRCLVNSMKLLKFYSSDLQQFLKFNGHCFDAV